MQGQRNDFFWKIACRSARTSKQICQDGPAGLVVLPGPAQVPGRAAHEQRGRAGALSPQRPSGQVLLPSPVPAVHEECALLERVRQLSARHARRAHRALQSAMWAVLTIISDDSAISNHSDSDSTRPITQAGLLLPLCGASQENSDMLQ